MSHGAYMEYMFSRAINSGKEKIYHGYTLIVLFLYALQFGSQYLFALLSMQTHCRRQVGFMRKKGEIEHKEQNEDPMGKLETGRKGS